MSVICCFLKVVNKGCHAADSVLISRDSSWDPDFYWANFIYNSNNDNSNNNVLV